MRTLSISLLLLVGIYFVSYFSLVAEKAGIQPPTVTYVKKLAVAIFPYYQSGTEQLAQILNERQYAVEKRRAEYAQNPQDNVATVEQAFQRLKSELWR